MANVYIYNTTERWQWWLEETRSARQMNRKSRNWENNLFDIINAVEYIEGFIQDTTVNEFIKNKKINFAALRSLDIIGKASRQIPDAVKTEHPAVPWEDMGRMIEKIIHRDFGIDFKEVWRIITEDIPAIEPGIREILTKKTH